VQLPRGRFLSGSDRLILAGIADHLPLIALLDVSVPQENPKASGDPLPV